MKQGIGVTWERSKFWGNNRPYTKAARNELKMPAPSKPVGKNKPSTSTDKSKPSEQKKLKLIQDAYKTFYGGKENSDTYNVVCLTLLIALLLVFGVALVAIGAESDISDLILIGVIFLVGCVIFVILMCVSVVRPMLHRNQVDNYRKFDNVEPPKQDVKPTEDPGVPEPYYYGYDNDIDDAIIKANNEIRPAETDLYGARSRSFLATPATSKDVRIMEGNATPPPPRVAMPGLGGKSNSVYSMDIDPAVLRDSPNVTSPVTELELL